MRGEGIDAKGCISHSEQSLGMQAFTNRGGGVDDLYPSGAVVSACLPSFLVEYRLPDSFVKCFGVAVNAVSQKIRIREKSQYQFLIG